MNLKPENAMVGLFMASAMLLFAWHNLTKPSILVLHSYDRDYAWSRDISVGLNRILKDGYRYRLRWHYMDTKRHPFEDYKRSAGIAARNVIEAANPDVVIAIDDDAQQYAARYFRDNPRIKIVFAGVNGTTGDYGYDVAHNVTGILERLPLFAMREALGSSASLKETGQPIRLAFLGDQSETVDGDAKQLRHFDWSPLQLTAIRQVDTWPQWQANVLELAASNDVLLVSGYRRLRRSATDANLVPPREVVAWTETHAKLPVISFNYFYMEDGGMLAIGASPYEQGEVAAALALDLALKRKVASALPITSTNQFVVSMNGSKMKAKHFILPRVYEAAARTGNLYLP